jgi:hypothetical protein
MKREEVVKKDFEVKDSNMKRVYILLMIFGIWAFLAPWGSLHAAKDPCLSLADGYVIKNFMEKRGLNWKVGKNSVGWIPTACQI